MINKHILQKKLLWNTLITDEKALQNFYITIVAFG